MVEMCYKMYHSPTKIFKIILDTSQKAYYESDPTQPHPNDIHIKVAAEGLDWCYIGPESGGNWLKLA